MELTRVHKTYKHLEYYEMNNQALYCGYRQVIEHGNRSLELWHESSHYHVRYIDWDRTPTSEELKLEYVQELGPCKKFRIWRSFTKSTDARKFFHKLLRDELTKQC